MTLSLTSFSDGWDQFPTFPASQSRVQSGLADLNETVDGCENLQQLIDALSHYVPLFTGFPIVYRFSTIQGDAGFRNHPQYVEKKNRQTITEVDFRLSTDVF